MATDEPARPRLTDTSSRSDTEKLVAHALKLIKAENTRKKPEGQQQASGRGASTASDAAMGGVKTLGRVSGLSAGKALAAQAAMRKLGGGRQQSGQQGTGKGD